MMSYLWILLLGSLLAAGAKAQDEAAPGEDVDAPEAGDVPVADPATDVNEEPATDEKTDHLPEDTQASDSGSDQEPGADEPVITDTEPEPALTDNPDPEADVAALEPEAAEPDVTEPEAAEPVAAEPEAAEPDVTEPEAAEPVAAEPDVTEPEAAEPVAAEPEAPEPDVTEPEAAEPEPEAAEPVAAEPEAAEPDVTEPEAAEPEVTGPEAAEPTADPEVMHPKTEETPALEEENGAAPESGAETDVTVEDNEETSTVVEEVDPGLEVKVPSNEVVAKKTDVSILQNAPAERESKGRSVNSGPEVLSANAEGKPEPNKPGSGFLAAILSTVGVTVVAAMVGYYTYQKKKLCFKNRQEADPEVARKADTTEAQSDPQVLSNLLKSS